MTCYRHPDREAYVRCQRCEELICPECQVESAVGFLCPDDAGGTQKQLNRQRARAMAQERPRLSIALIAICSFVWLLQLSPFGQTIEIYFSYTPLATTIAPWQMLTAAFLHGSWLHLLFNMFTLYIFGQVLEPMLGKARFLALYLVAAFGGSVAVLFFSNPASSVVGASGAIYGLMGAYFVLLRSVGERSGQLTGLIAINLIFSFLSPGISWQAHIGGLAIGAVVAAIYSSTRRPEQQSQQKVALLGLIVGLVLLTMFQVNAYGI
jgi:membrane associated rhomboid family serine protease